MTRFIAACTLFLLLGIGQPTNATPPSPAPGGATGATILDTSGFWRIHFTMRPPVVRDGQALRKLPTLAGDSPAPPTNWAAPDFDDSQWTRITGRPFPETIGGGAAQSYGARGTPDAGITGNEGSSPALAQMCLRGKFGVTDPAAVKDLKLSVTFRGGVIVYVNGKEVGRANMAKDTSGPEAVADDYPNEAFVKSDGTPWLTGRGRDQEMAAGLKARVRQAVIPIPAQALQKGVNVLGIEVHRAAYLPAIKAWIEKGKTYDHELYPLLWATCGLHEARLAGSPAGLTANITRPRDLQVWNSQPMQQDFDLDYGDPFEPLRPIKLVGSRGGVFSGKVAVGSDQPIKGLKATISALTRNKDGTIPAAAVQVRYALPTGSEPVGEAHYPAPATLFDALSDTPPPTVEVRTTTRALPGWPSYGAVCPVWVTVAVPPEAEPGDYTGTLTITADDAAKSIAVPVELKVCSWRVPDPGTFHTIVDLMESPESVAMQYGVPIYGEKHFQLLAKSFDRLGHVGNWTVHVPLIAQTNLGNEQTMVRWIKKPDGAYKFDFAPMDQYLDVVIQHMGKPRILILYVWDMYVGVAGKESVHPQIQKIIPPTEDVAVTLLDEATGAVSTGAIGTYDDKGKANWKTLVTELMEHLKKRGLDKAVLVGTADDVYPTAETVKFWKELLPDASWARYGHFEQQTLGGTGAPIGYQAHAAVTAWSIEPMYGWKRPDMTSLYFRSGSYETDMPWYSIPWDIARLLGELNIQGPRRGFGRIGLDFWPVIKNTRGQLVKNIHARYPKSFWRQNDMMISCLIPPGPDGAMATGKLEMMREGLQETEARILLEGILTDPARRGRLPAPLAAAAQQVLDDRRRALAMGLEVQPLAGFANNPKPFLDGYGAGDFHAGQAALFRMWYMESGWQQRSEKLFTVAGQVAEALR